MLSAVVVEWLLVQQPGEARRRRAGRGAAQRHDATRAQRLLDESVVQLRCRLCNVHYTCIDKIEYILLLLVMNWV